MVIISKTNLKKISNISRPYVFVPLAADILHHGHINILKKSNLLGSVIVGLITDKGLETYKGKPLLEFNKRKLIVKSIKYVDFIIPLSGLFFKEIIDKIKPDYFVHGDDWKRGPQKNARIETLQSMKKIGGKVIEIKYTKGVSSTKIKKFISQKNLLK